MVQMAGILACFAQKGPFLSEKLQSQYF